MDRKSRLLDILDRISTYSVDTAKRELSQVLQKQRSTHQIIKETNESFSKEHTLAMTNALYPGIFENYSVSQKNKLEDLKRQAKILSHEEEKIVSDLNHSYQEQKRWEKLKNQHKRNLERLETKEFQKIMDDLSGRSRYKSRNY